MNAQQLYTRTPSLDPSSPDQYKLATDRWFCGECRILKHGQEEAEACCVPKFCSVCQADLQSFYGEKCDDCIEKALFDKALLVPYDGSYFYCVDNDRYYPDFETFLDEHDGERWQDLPTNLRPCKEVKWKGLNIRSAYEHATEDLPGEDYYFEKDVVDVEKLFRMVDEWNKLQDIVYYEADMTKKIILAKPDDWSEPEDEKDGQGEPGQEKP